MVTNDHCPVEATLELIGGKYKSLILWHLAGGKLRFNELQKQLPSATPKMLTQQLRELEAQKLIHREVFPRDPAESGILSHGVGQKSDAHSGRHAGLGQRIPE